MHIYIYIYRHTWYKKYKDRHEDGILGTIVDPQTIHEEHSGPLQVGPLTSWISVLNWKWFVALGLGPGFPTLLSSWRLKNYSVYFCYNYSCGGKIMSGKENVIGSCYVKVASSQLYLSNKIVVKKIIVFFLGYIIITF